MIADRLRRQVVASGLGLVGVAMAGRGEADTVQAPAGTAEPAALRLEVTGRDLVINGVAELPRGLFGVHAVKLDPARVEAWGVEAVRSIHHVPDGQLGAAPAPFVLDCYYDRYQPAVCLTRPDWDPFLRDLGRRYAAAARASGALATRAVEFWNEPYLNWADKPGVNYDGAHFDLAKASPGAPMVTRLGGETLTNLVWNAPRRVAFRVATNAVPDAAARRAMEQSANVDYLATRYMPEAVRPGEVFQWSGRTYLAGERWWGRDRSQVSWWSGEANLALYLRMARPLAEGLKEVAPELPLVVGWGFHLFESNWRAWDVLHRPTLDALHPWIDGYGEHHYGVDPRRVAASYEIADAYMRARWGKRIGFWNTEAGGMQDPERPDVVRPLPQGSSLDETRGACAYFLRDVLTALHTVPDKARLRCAHEPQVNDGVPLGFQLLKPLRGQLLETAGAGDGVWSVAARAPARLTVACYNSTSGARAPAVHVAAPAGARLAGLERRRLVVRDGRLTLDSEVVPLTTPVTNWDGRAALGPGEAEVLVFALAGDPQPERLHRDQFVGDAILQEVAAGKPAQFRVAVPATARRAAWRARVRWVVAGADAVLRVRCGDLPLPAPHACGPFREAEIPPATLRDANVIAFEVEGWESTVVGTVSVVLDSRDAAGSTGWVP